MSGIELFSPSFFTALLSIIMIDLVLAGDNSIVIAMAVQSLPPEKKIKGIIFGALAAVVLRVVFTFFASQLLVVAFVKLIGGLAILWIAVKLMAGTDDAGGKGRPATSVWNAVWTILIADVTMSIDNILAVAGASHGSLLLLLFGLGLSIPLVVFASSMISKIMGRFPAIMWIGAIILGKVGGEMIVTDPVIVSKVLASPLLAPYGLTQIGKLGMPAARHGVVLTVEIAAAVMVVAIALVVLAVARKQASANEMQASAAGSGKA